MNDQVQQDCRPGGLPLSRGGKGGEAVRGTGPRRPSFQGAGWLLVLAPGAWLALALPILLVARW